MNVIGVGSWQFELPEDWIPQEAVEGIPYFESIDGTMGCYIKGISFGESQISDETAAQYLQGIHERNYLADQSANWVAVHRSGLQTTDGFLSKLDFLDQASTYRVVSVVLSNVSEALQVTLHDYDCQSYDTSATSLAPIVASLRRVQSID